MPEVIYFKYKVFAIDYLLITIFKLHSSMRDGMRLSRPMSKYIATVIFLTILFTVSACGGSGGDNTTSTNPDVTTPSVVTVTPLTNTTISTNQDIVVVFDESMDPGSLVLTGTLPPQSDGGVWSSASNNNDTLTLTPNTTWVGGSATLTIDVTDSAGNPLPTLSLSYNVDDIPPPVPDVIAPSVVTVTPLTNTTISADEAIVVVFNESMNPGSLALSDTLASQIAGPIWATTTNTNDTLTLTPATNWVGGSATLTIDVTDSAGNPLPTLSLSYNVDDIPPTGNELPADGDTIGPDTAIVINFSESMDAGSLVLTGTLPPQSDGGVWSSASNNNDTLTLTPITTWGGGSATLTIDVTDPAGNPLPTLSLGYNVDDIPPTGNASPANGDTIGPDTGIVINFSESIDPGSLELTGTLPPESDGGVWSSISNNNDTLTLSPAPATTWPAGDGTIIVDAADLYGNALSQLSLTYTIGTPVSATVTPNNGSKISNAEQIVIIFNESIDTNTLDLKGSMASVSDGGIWSTTTELDDTLTISTTTGWPLGTATNLSVTVSSLLGIPLTTLNLIYEVVPHTLYVRDSDGDDNNPGTDALPYKNIRAAIAAATISPANIHVAEGNYTEHNLAMVEGVSLYGGYDGTDWNNRDTSNCPTIVTDSIASGDSGLVPHTVFLIGDGIGNTTVIDGFTIEGGGGDKSSAILIAGDSTYRNSSPIIQNNILNGGNGSARTYAILNTNSSAPLIQNNIIFGGKDTQRSVGIENSQSFTPIIRNNVIHGGVAIQTTRAIDNFYDVNAAVIQNNTIYSGIAPDSKGILYGINAAPANIENNIIFGGTYCIYESVSDDPGVLRNNNLSACTTLYGDHDSGQHFDTICDPSGNFGNSDCSITLNTPIGTDNSDVYIDAVTDTEFADFDGLDNDVNTVADNDWHLTISSPVELRTEALDLSPLFNFDKDGIVRTGNGTTGWSRGAYERD
jgi:hypothetical protein